METKVACLPFEIKEMISVDGGGWEVAGYASTFGGSADSYGDIVARGAFTESLASRATKFLFEHQTPIGRQLELREDDRGLFGRWAIVDSSAGTDAYKLIKGGVLDSLSIGYVTKEADFAEDGTRILRKVDLFEVSAVAIPANVNAVITDVKADQPKTYPSFDARSEDVRIAVSEWLAHARAGLERRAQDGREPSEARKELMAVVSGSLREVADEVAALLTPPAPTERLNLGLELRRRRLIAAGILERPA